ncbi:hypothetical protein GCM10028827_17390 [Mucilaginibacter myungsuensis]
MGTIIEYHVNGNPKAVFNSNAGQLWGEAEAYYPNGKLYYSGKYTSSGIFQMYEKSRFDRQKMVEQGNGEFVRYDPTFSMIKERGYYKNGLRNGEWKSFADSGKVLLAAYQDGLLKKGDRVNMGVNGDEVLTKSEKTAEYIGGLDAFYKLVERNLRYPEKARSNNIQGRVSVTFIIERDGAITDITVKSGIGSGCDEEAVRCIKLSSGNWQPGVQDGLPVRVRYTVPIGFTLAGDN